MVHRKLGIRLNGRMVTEIIIAHTHWVVGGLLSIKFSPISAGCPNVTGTFSNNAGYQGHSEYYNITGCFKGSFTSTGTYPLASSSGTSTATYRGVSMSLSNSNSIFGKSNTITPLSMKCKYFIKYKK